MSTQCYIVDKSIRADVNFSRHDFERRSVLTFTWFPGKKNLADPGAKSACLLVDDLCRMIEVEVIRLTFKLPNPALPAVQSDEIRQWFRESGDNKNSCVLFHY